MKTAEIKELTIQELQDRLATEKEALLRMKLNHSISPLENPLRIRYARRDIARMMTELCKREINSKN